MKIKTMVWSKKRKNWVPITKKDFEYIVSIPNSSIHILPNRHGGGELLLYEPDKGSPGQLDRMKKVE